MKANELRIGNLILWRGGDADEWIEGTMEHKDFIDCERHPEWFRPIPLNEQWLKDFGFEKDNGIQQDYSYVLDIKARIKIVYYKGDPNCLSLYQDGNFCDFASGSHKHVHQLQNLFYSLCGHELNMNKNGKESISK